MWILWEMACLLFVDWCCSMLVNVRHYVWNYNSLIGKTPAPLSKEGDHVLGRADHNVTQCICQPLIAVNTQSVDIHWPVYFPKLRPYMAPVRLQSNPQPWLKLLEVVECDQISKYPSPFMTMYNVTPAIAQRLLRSRQKLIAVQVMKCSAAGVLDILIDTLRHTRQTQISLADNSGRLN